MSSRYCVFLAALGFALFGLGHPCVSYAQEIVDQDSFVDDIESLDHVDQSTPLKTAQGFMRFAELGEYERAANYLDLRYLPDELDVADSQKLAEQLYIVISRKLRIDLGALSDESPGIEDDGLPSYRDALGEINSPNGKIPIYLQRIPGPDESTIWKISNATVARLPDLYAEFGYSPFVETVRSFSPNGAFLGAELFKWIVAILAGVAGTLAWLIVAWPLSKFLTRRNSANTERVTRYLTRPIPAAIFIVLGGAVLRNLGLGLTASRFAAGGTMRTIVIVWLLFATINLLRDLYAKFLVSRGRNAGLMLLGPAASTLKVLIAILATTIWLDNNGVNVTALVAGLGVGGLAVALVLQKPLEDILGAVTLYAQQPVTVGHLCTSGTITGVIEDIGLRSTRVRKIDNSLAIIPNSIFATASIENVSVRQRILHRQTVRLSLGTTESQISDVLGRLRDILKANADVIADSWRVRFVEIGEFSVNIDVFAHINTTDWSKFLEISENINLRTIGALGEAGVDPAVRPR